MIWPRWRSEPARGTRTPTDSSTGARPASSGKLLRRALALLGVVLGLYVIGLGRQYLPDRHPTSLRFRPPHCRHRRT